MKAKTVRIEYRPGERYTIDGVKGHWDGVVDGGSFFRNAGYGVGEAFRPSLLLLHTTYRGKKLVVRIDRFFKEKLGKLIETRRKLIEMKMPEEVSVKRLQKNEVVIDPMFEKEVAWFSHEVVTSDLKKWLSRVNGVCKQELVEAKKSALSDKEKRQELERQVQAREDREGELIWRRMERAKQQRQRHWRKKIDELIAKGGSKYLKATFTVGQHRQTGEGQFEFAKDGKLYVLRRQDSHVEPKEEQYVSIDRELVPGRIYLVRKEHCY